MSEVKPFKGITYDISKLTDAASVFTPPYDVISEHDQDKYYGRHDHNIVRVILGNTKSSDDDKDNRYSRAADSIKEWLSEGYLLEDKQPCLYVYRQQFSHNGKQYSRKGFIGLVKLGADGSVKFHENTFQKAKDDRMQLLKATLTNTEPIFLLYKGYAASIPEQKPVVEFKDDNSDTHTLWRIENKEEIDDFCADFKDKPLYIADGHHRFETAYKYARDMKIDPKSDDPRNYVMAYFVEQSDPGLLVLPTHRLLNISAEDIELIQKNAKNYFLTIEIDSFEKIERASGKVFGFFSRKDNKLYMLKLRDVVAKDKIMKAKGKSDQANLEVAILHSLLLDDVIEKYKGDTSKSDVIAYSHDDKDAVAMVRSGKYSCAFLLNTTKVSTIMDTADAGGRMPQKSTFFYPKAYSGLVMRRFG